MPEDALEIVSDEFSDSLRLEEIIVEGAS